MNDASVKEKAPSARAELKVILDHFGASKKDFVMSGLCVFAESLLELVIPVLMAQIVDQGILQGNLQTVFVNEEVDFSIHDLKEGMTVKVKGIVSKEERAPHGRELQIREIQADLGKIRLDRMDHIDLYFHLIHHGIHRRDGIVRVVV